MGGKIAWMMLAAALVVGCSQSKAPSDTSGAGEGKTAATSGDSSSDAPTEGDPCSLLTQAEVEKAIGPLAGPPYREGNRGPDVQGSKCVYETRDLRSLELDVTWSDGASLMKMMGMPAAVADQAGMRGKLPLPDGVTVSGEWDEAKALDCCDITALRGDQVIDFRFMNTRLTSAQGVELLNAALKRLESPLKDIDGAAGVPAAEARAKSGTGRPKPIPACQLVTLEDATALLGPVEVLPVNNDMNCQYRSSAKYKLIDFKVTWSGGYRSLRSDSELAGKVIKGMMGDLAKDPAEVKTVEYPGPWEHAEVVVASFIAVRKDVRMSVDIRGVSLEQAQALVAKAMNRVAWPP